MATVATYRAPAHTIDNGRGPRPSRIPVRARPVDVCLDSPTLPDLASTARKPGFQLLHSLPTELLELALHLLDLVDLLRLCAVDRSLNTLLRHSRHYRNVSLSHLPTSRHGGLVLRLPRYLGGTRHLSLRSFPAPTLAKLLPACDPHRLTTLDLSFSSVSDDELALLFAGGSRDGAPVGSGFSLRSLRLKGCRRVADFLSHVASKQGDSPASPVRDGLFPNLAHLDLSWSSVSSLRLPLATHLPALRSLNLSTTPYLTREPLLSALATLPPRLTDLDLSHLNLSARELAHIAFEPERDALEVLTHGPQRSKPLRLVLAGNDHLTLSALSSLESHWSTTLPRCKLPVRIEHGGLLLESDEEDDVRRFVEMVAGVVMREGRHVGRTAPDRTE